MADKKIKDVSLVTSVNGSDKMPVSQGGNSAKTISVDQVKDYVGKFFTSGEIIPALAKNLLSPTDLEDSNVSFIERTTGGSKSVRSGQSILKKIRGNAVVPTKVQEVLADSPTINEAANFTATIVTTTDGDYNCTYNGTAWSVNEVAVEDIAVYATIVGTPINGDSFAFSVVEGAATAPTYTYASRMTIVFTKATWRSAVSASGTYVFTKDAEGWLLNDVAIEDIAAYGIAITGESRTGDTLTIAYVKQDFGTIAFPTPTAFKALGFNEFNCFDANTMVLDGYTITDGVIVAAEGSRVAYARAIYNEDNVYSGDNTKGGYVAFDSNGTITAAGWCANVPVAGASVVTTNTSGSGDLKRVKFSANGYIAVALTDTSKLCIHPSWSGYMDRQYTAYTESVVTIPTKDASGNDLVGAFWAVGSYRNEIDFAAKTYTQYVTREAYSAARYAELIAAGYVQDVDVDYDNNYIYYVYESETIPVVNLAASVSGEYNCNDFSIEEFIGTSVAVHADLVYGENLVDKLRTDVLTTSTGMLKPKKVNLTAVDGTFTIPYNNLHKLGTLGTGAYTIALQSIPSGDNENVYVYDFIFSTGSTAPSSVTFPNGITWMGGNAPTIAASKTYEVNIVDNLAVIGEF